MIIGGKYFRKGMTTIERGKRRLINCYEDSCHEDIILSIKASMSFEGLEPSEYVVDLLKQYSDGELIEDEVIIKIKEKHNIK